MSDTEQMHAALTTLALFAAASILAEAVRRPRGVVERRRLLLELR